MRQVRAVFSSAELRLRSWRSIDGSPGESAAKGAGRSGGGKVEKFDLKRKAEELGAEVFLIGGSEPVDVAELTDYVDLLDRGTGIIFADGAGAAAEELQTANSQVTSNAAETSASSAIALWTELTVVSRSWLMSVIFRTVTPVSNITLPTLSVTLWA